MSAATTADLRCAYGKLRVHHLAVGPDDRAPLICLHPAPFDGSYFEGFAQPFSGDRNVLAPDYPGYGKSAAPPARPTVDDYAGALLAALLTLTPGKLHLLGFHTGCLVACEMALQQPERIGDLVLIDVPYFNGIAQQKKYAESVTDQPDSWGFAAAFSYPCAARFAALDKRALVIATGSNLAEPTQEATAALNNARLENCADVTRPALKNGRDQFVDLIRAFLHD